MADSELESYAKDLELQLVQARRNPGKTALELLVFRLLFALSSGGSVLPQRMVSRFARSAAKRDPYRSLVLNSADEPKLQQGFRVLKGARPRDPAKPTVLVVTHETSRTGAPVLALNLGEELARRYNVVFFALGPGALLDAFRETSSAVFTADRLVVRARVYQDMVRQLLGQGEVAFAVVNSVESSAVLPALKAARIQVVTLIHEFASYTPNRDKVFGEINAASIATVFSSPLTLENAIETGVIEPSDRVQVIPQGRCNVPSSGGDASRREEEVTGLRNTLRPAGAENRFLVLGAGSVEIRKGLDLFIESANQLVQGPGGDRYDFVWLGGGYDPNRDHQYSVYLADQIRRSGLEGRLRILPPTSEIETAYRTADVFVLASRLDPLPNVTVDALSFGLPVVCFDRASGIAPILAEAGLGEACVARYLDASDLSSKVRALATDGDLLAFVRNRSRETAEASFDFSGYAARIERLALPSAAETDPKRT
ncbi:glycosyltransferase family 4 protein [Defluviimonas sp. D31]|uniref:glycosyltransferase family 4 protein n=1 Tax=Defluviimonas sp. D31 TaxID=3083253 RepID=UPI00296E5C30|nr:glycosyltransferase family 4 protein [Defluviimonas sp. D31]MDW4549328.1 glycosyltransferase family 4 protein [Defluviimonas sp. D31]